MAEMSIFSPPVGTCLKQLDDDFLAVAPPLGIAFPGRKPDALLPPADHAL
jgi:hypothetical protein